MVISEQLLDEGEDPRALSSRTVCKARGQLRARTSVHYCPSLTNRVDNERRLVRQLDDLSSSERLLPDEQEVGVLGRDLLFDELLDSLIRLSHHCSRTTSSGLAQARAR